MQRGGDVAVRSGDHLTARHTHAFGDQLPRGRAGMLGEMQDVLLDEGQALNGERIGHLLHLVGVNPVTE